MEYRPNDSEGGYRYNEMPSYQQYQPGYLPEQCEFPPSQQEQQQQWQWGTSQEKLILVSDKKWLPAFLFFIFLSPFAAHRFYAGKVGTAILQLCLGWGFLFILPLLGLLDMSMSNAEVSLLTLFQIIANLGFIGWLMVDYILLMNGSFTDKQGRKLDRPPIKGGNKSWVAAMIYCSFLGYLGAHRFYAGKIVTGILQLLTFGGFGIWVFVDLILLITGEFRDSKGNLLSRDYRPED